MITLEGHEGIEDITFKNNEVCLSGGRDKEIAVWDIRCQNLQHKIGKIHENDINSLSMKGNYIVSGGEEGRVNIIDDRKYEAIYQFDTNKSISAIQFNPVNDFFAVGTDVLEFHNLERIEASK